MSEGEPQARLVNWNPDDAIRLAREIGEDVDKLHVRAAHLQELIDTGAPPMAARQAAANLVIHVADAGISADIVASVVFHDQYRNRKEAK